MALDLSSGRYVFFKSMKNAHDPTLRAAYTQATTNIGNTTSQIFSQMESHYQSETDKELNSIKSYMDFVDYMVDVESAAADDFFAQQLQIMRQNGENQLADDLEQYLTGSCKDDPMNFIKGLNELFQSSKVFEENMKTQLGRLTSFSNDMKEFTDETRKEIQEAFDENYRAFRGKLLTEISNLGEKADKSYSKEFKNINSILASAVNQVLNKLSKNGDFIQQIQNAYQGNLKLTDGDFKAIVVNTVVDSILQTRSEELLQNLTQNVQEALRKVIDDASAAKDQLANDYIKLTTTKNFKTIEEIALTAKKSFGKILLDLDDITIDKLKERYPNTKTMLEDLKKLQEDDSITSNKLTREANKLGQVLKQEITNSVTEELQKIGKQFDSSKISSSLSEIKNCLTPTSLSSSLSTQLRYTSISQDAIAEALVSHEARTKIKNVLLSNTPGTEIKLKADVEFAVSYVGGGSVFIDESQAKEILNNTIKSHFKDFMKKYNEKGSGATNIEAAKNAYVEHLEEMKKQIDDYVKDNNLPDDSRQELYQKMYETFRASVSVKSYEFYNDLGVHGGNLGPGKVAEGVINNITNLYQMGGITPVDAEKILFAAINCGSDMVGSDIKQHLETYLLGGAALMMFDDCFANTKKFLEDTKRNMEGFAGQKTVHFYRVQDMYAPASFILKEISSNLKTMYQDLSETVDYSNIVQHNRVTIDNPVTEKDIPESGTREEKFNAVSKKAQAKTKISFSFMGGLLDAFDNIGKAFEQK